VTGAPPSGAPVAGAPFTGGRFTAPGRDMGLEDRVVLLSVGVDIGSSTSHLLFSRLELERADDRYVTAGREVLHRSDILLTPYLGDATIDDRALGRFLDAQYAAAGIRRSDVDTGALILTGVALDRRNARAVAELFAQDAGRLVAVSAGDNLEALMAAHGSGAVELSASGPPVLAIDIGGGTTKAVVCRNGSPDEAFALDVGARLVAFDTAGVITRLEPAGRRFGARLGLDLEVGRTITTGEREDLAAAMVDVLLQAVGPSAATAEALRPFCRTPLPGVPDVGAVTFSGGVSEFFHERAAGDFGDLGPYLAAELRARRSELPGQVVVTPAGIRATVIGAAEHTVQVSGSTVCIAPLSVLPMRNVPVVLPRFGWDDDLDRGVVGDAVSSALRRFDLTDAAGPAALAFRWDGSATYTRISEFAAGVAHGLRAHIAAGHPVVMVFDGDIGGLIGLHLIEDLRLDVPVISVDGVELREFDYIDVGELIASSGAVPLVIKSLVFSSPHPV
jgi:ethanolamine utilization protein EutA